MNRIVLVVFLLLGAGLLAGAYLGAGFVLPGGLALGISVGWVVGVLRRWRGVSTAGMFGMYGLAGAGVFFGLPVGGLIAASLCILLAWDLANFETRLGKAAPEDDRGGLTRRHYARLGLVLLGGAAACLLALNWRVKFSFEWTVVLVLAGVWMVGHILRWMLRNGD